MVSFPRIVLAIAGLIPLSIQCSTDEECSLNGVCSTSSGHCKCDRGWRGSDCGELDIRPAARSAGYNHTSEGTSSWGSKIVRDPHESDLYHLFFAEFEHGCGLDYWAPYSRIVRAESKTGPAGPYHFAAEVVGAFAHNPTVVWSQTEQLYLLYYIGCPQTVNTTTCEQTKFTCGEGNSNNGESGISVQASHDLIHWSPYGQILKGSNDMELWDADTTNPSPHVLVYPNSDNHHGHEPRPEILLAYRGCPYNCSSGNELISLATAPCAAGPYTRLNQHEPIFNDPAEDPFVWQDRRGNFHMLVHSLEADGAFGNGPKVGRHAYARDMTGPWTFAGGDRALAFSTKVEFDDGSTTDYFRRERPQLFFDEEMNLLYLTTGVQEVGSPMSYTLIVPVGGR